MIQKIGLDLDGIIIDLPPFAPKKLIDWLYEDRKSTSLRYRIPSLFEQKIRQLSHLPFIRPPLQQNCDSLLKAHQSGKYEFYLITGRFGFLNNLTHAWLKYNHVEHLFTKTYINMDNQQPHFFKEKILKKITINSYLEDDFKCLMYLAPRFKNIHFYFYDRTGNTQLDKDNVTAVSSLDTVFK